MSNKVVFVITGETRTWNRYSYIQWTKVFDIIKNAGHQVIVQGYTWNYCKPPIEMESNLVVFNYDGAWVKPFLKYEHDTLLKYSIPSDVEFFKNLVAQAWTWSYALNDAYQQHDPDIVFKIRWDEMPSTNRGACMVKEAADQFINAINTAASKENTNIAIVQAKSGHDTPYSDQVFGVNKKWLSDAFDTHTVDQYYEVSQIQHRHYNGLHTLCHDHIRFLEYNNPYIEYNCLDKTAFATIRGAGEEYYSTNTDLQKCQGVTERPKT